MAANVTDGCVGGFDTNSYSEAVLTTVLAGIGDGLAQNSLYGLASEVSERSATALFGSFLCSCMHKIDRPLSCCFAPTPAITCSHTNAVMIGNGVAGIIVTVLRVATKSVFPDDSNIESVDMYVQPLAVLTVWTFSP